MTEYESTCLGKVPFDSRADARRRARQIRRCTGNRLRPYQCPFCHRHHLGHPPGKATHLRRGIPLEDLTP